MGELPNLRKELGRITNVSFGYGGYQESQIALNLTFEGKGWRTNWCESAMWAPSIIEHCDYSKWSEIDRDESFAILIRKIDKILKTAKVETIDRLLNKPIECIFDGNLLKSWRILEEVL